MSAPNADDRRVAQPRVNREVPIDILVPKLDELELTAHILVFKKRVDFRRIPDTEATGIQLADR